MYKLLERVLMEFEYVLPKFPDVFGFNCSIEVFWQRCCKERLAQLVEEVRRRGAVERRKEVCGAGGSR